MVEEFNFVEAALGQKITILKKFVNSSTFLYELLVSLHVFLKMQVEIQVEQPLS